VYIFFTFKKDKAILADSAASVSMEIGSGIYISNACIPINPFRTQKKKILSLWIAGLFVNQDFAASRDPTALPVLDVFATASEGPLQRPLDDYHL